VRLAAAALGIVLSVSAAPPSAEAFRDVAIGAQLRNRELPSLDGRATPLLGRARANVFVFVRSGQAHSAAALAQLAKLEDELRGKSVRLVAIVSGDDPADEVRAMVREAGVKMPVLVDAGDAFYGEVGVSLHPSLGIADERHRLVAYQPFRKLNFLDAVRGRVRLALGEIGEAELASILDPPAAPTKVNRATARLNLARKLLEAGAIAAAIESARKAVALDPALAEAHALLAEALARGGECGEAEREAGEARRLEPMSVAVVCAPR
jgi:tetratricopeptide (TPR) repeat protein